MTIRLYHRNATPALVQYHGRPIDLLAANRGKFVAAALTIVSAWQQAGSPRADVPSLASYEDWSDLCRQPLLWLGLPDPAASVIEQLTDDPDQDALSVFLRAWHTALGDRSVTLRQLLDQSENDTDLRECIEDLPAINGDVINRSKLGWYLKQNANRPVNGLELRKANLKERNSWCVVAIEDQPPD